MIVFVGISCCLDYLGLGLALQYAGNPMARYLQVNSVSAIIIVALCVCVYVRVGGGGGVGLW